MFYNYIACQYQTFKDWAENEEEFTNKMIQYMKLRCGDKYTKSEIDSVYII